MNKFVSTELGDAGSLIEDASYDSRLWISGRRSIDSTYKVRKVLYKEVSYLTLSQNKSKPFNHEIFSRFFGHDSCNSIFTFMCLNTINEHLTH